MPELPEVETIRRVMDTELVGATIARVDVRRADVIAHPAASSFAARLVGAQIVSTGRRAKFLLFRLASGEMLVIHLRMTGCVLVMPAGTPEEPHTHVVFHLADGREWRFSDTRRFGRLWLLTPEEAEKGELCGFDQLGLEPLSAPVTGAALYAHLHPRRKAIKDCLLEQTFIVGIGNIYSDEILFSVGIHPARLACDLTHAECDRLAAAIPARLQYFVETNAISPEDYRETKGKDYRNTPFLQVYGHAGEPCPVCGTALEKMRLGGRSSTFCPHCQPLKKGRRKPATRSPQKP